MASKPGDMLGNIQQIPGAKPSEGSMSREVDPKLKKVLPQAPLAKRRIAPEQVKRFMV